MSRRRLLSGLLASACMFPGAQAATSGWPDRPIQLIVPWPAGGATDLTLRILCEEAEPLLGQRLIVVNRPGAAGTQVAPALKMAESDGYTIGQVPITVYRHALMHAVPWNPLVDFSPIIQVSGTTFGIVVPAASPWRSLHDMIDWALRHPGEFLLGSTGIGTTAHLAMEEILIGQGVRYVHVPYKGTADQMLAVAGGQLMAGVNSTGFAPWVDQGKLRLLGIFSAQRSPRWPDVPTLVEMGYPQAVYTSPWGLAAPAGTPEVVIQRLHDAFRAAMHTERHRQALARYDQQLDYLNTQDYRRALVATVARERSLLARMNLLHRSETDR
ncbi:MAG TPA: tripartite tricarboxylate transporter substrate binding protein [Hydrogenophaga sp.]|uniref:Bug family tripartite tricarboxylate transporter substrate binding protein n=1 Tax=Hydrogenophaga sp. TaxID=1904254 RepID=UPI002C088E89|nr:tripartite tricarboxylate transporter substrate binding protein [Hydrogenophaga sp.]HMN92280.1 tripartite tricarboxylate transporter substrate binding protein [Hydrogenophaga sp.]HMP09315.1 tripartite tricarboxylate transporter substrate binding protein [Hydrogenophaga sp.]